MGYYGDSPTSDEIIFKDSWKYLDVAIEWIFFDLRK